MTEEPPDRALGGGNIREAHLFERLASTFPTDLLTVGAVSDQRVLAAARSLIQIRRRHAFQSTHPLGRRALELAINLASPYPVALYAARHCRRELAEAIGKPRRTYDLVCVEHETLAPLIPPNREERWIITFHHLLSGMIESELAMAPGRRQRWFRRRELEKARRLEWTAVRSYDRCIVCSENDANALAGVRSELQQRISVIPNGVDLDLYRVTPVPAEPRILLPGTLAWGPNVDGAIWFCSKIWPQIRTVLPNAELVLAGRSPVPEVLALERVGGVRLYADVPSMVPYFESARAVVVPLRVGTGTRLKALEAMAAARPVVGTSVGLEGIGVSDGEEALIADDPEQFAGALVRVLRQDELARSLAGAGRRHVESRFGWDRIGDRFVATVSELLDRSPKRA